jgi:hypothetical protein
MHVVEFGGGEWVGEWVSEAIGSLRRINQLCWSCTAVLPH